MTSALKRVREVHHRGDQIASTQLADARQQMDELNTPASKQALQQRVEDLQRDVDQREK